MWIDLTHAMVARISQAVQPAAIREQSHYRKHAEHVRRQAMRADADHQAPASAKRGPPVGAVDG
jgi:hypothetical protein